ncbi:MAG: hypothetical protein IKO01_05835 [Kiritimatiellae bacterium]|nr:hypothetical protein [Kiritimatiellia bacterium]
MEKFFARFPTIGKNFRPIFRKPKEQNGQQNNRRTKPSDNSDNSRQLFEETTWTTWDNSFKVPGGQLRPAAGSEWDCGREENDKQDKEDKIVGGKREEFQP